MTGAGIAFSELNADCLYGVFKYLPLRERVKYERVDSVWKRILRKLWASQLALGVLTLRYAEDKATPFGSESCHERRHQLRTCDVFLNEYRWGVALDERPYYKIISRCRNLRAVYWERTSFGAEFGAKLALYCPRIEHIMLKEVKFAYGLLPYVESVTNGVSIKCIQLEATDVDVPSILTLCPNIRTLYWDHLALNSEILVTFGPKLKELRVGVSRDLGRVFSCLTDLCFGLEKVYFMKTLNNNLLDESQVLRLSRNLNKLTSLEINCNSKVLPLLGSLKGLKELIFWPEIQANHKVRYNEEAFHEFQAKSGKLTKLTLKECDLKDTAFSLLGTHCPHIVNLDIDFTSYLMTNRSMGYFSALRRLRRLQVSQTLVSNEGVAKLLEGCLRLTSLGFAFNYELTGQVIPFLVKYAEKHRRPIEVNLFETNVSETSLRTLRLPLNLKLNESY